MSFEAILGAWVSVGLTLAVFSFLYRDNPFFKVAEHLYIGVSVGYGVTQTIFNFMARKWYTPLFQEGRLSLLIPTALGILIILRLIPQVSWLSRWAFAFIVGVGAGMSIPRVISSNLLKQIGGTLVPLVSRDPLTGLGYTWGNFNALIILVGVLTVLIYFFFSIEHRGPIATCSRIGVTFLMIYFGASFGFTAMGRVSLLFGRCHDLVLYSGSGYYYATPILLVGIVLALAAARLARRSSSTSQKE